MCLGSCGLCSAEPGVGLSEAAERQALCLCDRRQLAADDARRDLGSAPADTSSASRLSSPAADPSLVDFAPRGNTTRLKLFRRSVRISGQVAI